MATKKAKHPHYTNGRLPAGQMLAKTSAHETGRDVIIVGSGRRGKIYLSSSMPSRSVADLNNSIDLLKEAIGRLERLRGQLEKDGKF